ncbi:predicted protein, partial [Thalassiosira pseudonana CCMP1335]
QRHGRGKMVYASGNTFEGEFVNNKMEGDKGIYKWAGDGGYFDGFFTNNVYDKKGVYKWADGDEYDGEWADELDGDGKRTGTGTMTYDSNNIYEGGFVSDAYSGDGKYKWFDGDEYEGQWKDGERHGLGIFRLADGGAEYSMYEKGGGLDAAGKRTGHGIMTYESGGCYEGGFVNDKYEDDRQATYRWADGDSYKGQWKNGERNGKGAFQTSLGADNGDWGSYKGGFDARGKRTGHGVMTYESNSVYDGEFVDDVYSGEGNYRWSDGDSYQGQWKDGERHGKGIF